MATRGNANGPVPWQLRVVRPLRLPYPVSWLILVFVMFMIGAGLIWLTEDRTRDLYPSCYVCLLFSSILVWAISVAVIYYHNLLTESLFPNLRLALVFSKEQADDWEISQREAIFSNFWNIIFGIGLVVLLLPITYNRGVPYESLTGRILQGLLIGATLFTGGSMFYVMLAIGGMTRKIGRSVKIRIHVLQSLTETFNIVSTFIIKVCLVAGLIYSVGIFFASYRNMLITEQDEILTPLSKVVRLIFGLFLIGYFIFTRSGVRRATREAKKEKADKMKALFPTIQKHFETALKNEELSFEDLGHLGGLLALYEGLNASVLRSFGKQGSAGLISIAGSMSILEIIDFIIGVVSIAFD